MKKLMNRYLVWNIRILDETGCPSDIISLRDVVSEKDGGQCAVIMACGEGRRLKGLSRRIFLNLW